MPAIYLNHVSVSARNLDESTRFYEELLGMERIPTPNFGGNVQWLRIGAQQLHLAEREVTINNLNHFGITVDDFVTVYRRAKETGILNDRMQGYHLCELPDGNVQLYVKDPAGNTLEINHPDVNTLPDDIRADVTRLVDAFPQSDSNLEAKLYVEPEDARV
ncbi:MAG: VOC family protein [Sphaerobacteraceae bacterium]|nr:MAG: VOC family protein [Sphaerobacteraceae bacterium]